jgi:hypothetical protein
MQPPNPLLPQVVHRPSGKNDRILTYSHGKNHCNCWDGSRALVMATLYMYRAFNWHFFEEKM